MASCRALTASLPVKRAIIFCLNASENGFVTESLPSRPANYLRKQATTILTLGASHIGNTFRQNRFSIGSRRHVSSSKYPKSKSMKLTSRRCSPTCETPTF